MALRSVVNRCANSPERIPAGSGLGQDLGAKNRLHFEAGVRPDRARQVPDSILTESMITGSSGTAQAKADALEAAGVRVGRNPTEVAELMQEVLANRP